MKIYIIYSKYANINLYIHTYIWIDQSPEAISRKSYISDPKFCVMSEIQILYFLLEIQNSTFIIHALFINLKIFKYDNSIGQSECLDLIV